MSRGLFGDMFDLNNDGRMDALECATELEMLKGNAKELAKELENFCQELESAGLDIDEFYMMDDEERREVLEDAGLDLNDYDF